MNEQERKSYREKLVAVPDELKALRNWVCYRMEERHGQPKPTKVPYNPMTGEKAKANDPATWTDYETCVAAVERGEYDGIGFEFGNGFVGVDLDHCRDAERGEIQDWAADVIARLDSYTEASPSGTGVHIIMTGSLPPGRRRVGPIEMYSEARFFTVTGEHISGTPRTVEPRSDELRELHEALFPPEEASEAIPAPLLDCATNLLSDAEIIAKASAAANGEKFNALWSGNWRGLYPSQSEADEALCCELAFWTGRDTARMDGLFRQSGLYRQKWERNDYRGDTLARAVARTATTYTVSKRERVEKLYAALAAERTGSTGGDQTPAPATTAYQSAQERQETGIPEEDGAASLEFADFRYSQTDLGNSERFIRQHGENVRYCVETKTWHRWNGTRWEPDTLNQIPQLAKATVKGMYAELPLETDEDKRKALFKFIQRSESERSLNALVNLAKTDPRIAVSAAAFDTQLLLLNCKNGTLDLRTGTLLPHRREHLITKQCPVIFDPAAKSAVWEGFLRDCTRGDAELQSFLQRAVGYTLSGDPREGVIFLVHGPGATGKSTFIAAVMNVLGDYATTADFATFLKKDRVSSGPSDDIANLAGARLVSSIEVDDGRQLAQALVKQLTGGDVIRARHLYQGSFEFLPQFALWLVCNHAPAVAHDDDAMWRRILRLPFEHKIPAGKQDKTLKATLTDVALTGPAILAWAVQGCVEWYQHGLKVPPIVERATKSYQAQSNPVADFVAEACILHPSAFTTVADLRGAYASWVHETGERVLLGRTEFVAALRDIGCTTGSRRAGRGWVGIALKSDANSLYDTIRKTPGTTLSQLFAQKDAMELPA
jgi:phage/plasmid primase, P4 family, C-terminal domain